MAYYKPINLVEGDDLPALEIILRDSNKAAAGTTLDVSDPTTWNPIDTTNMTSVVLKFRKIGTTTPVHSIIFTRIQPYADGKVIMDWGSTTLDGDVGDYEAEIEMTYSDGKVLTIPDKFKFIVRSQF